MRSNHILPPLDLQLFAEAGSAGAVAAAQGEGGAATQAEQHSTAGGSHRSNTGDDTSVVFGKGEQTKPSAQDQSPDAGGNQTQDSAQPAETSPENKRAAFRKLIEGEYKEQYTELFQNAFNRRFKEMKGMERSLNAQKPIMDLLMQRYGVGDLDQLRTAMEQDNGYWVEAAREAGMPVEGYKAIKRLERENAQLRTIQRRQEADRHASEKVMEWYGQAGQVKELYPNFDFQTEAADRDFVGLLKAGLNVRQAYELKHMEEIKAAAARSAAQAAGQQMAARIQSKAARPQENGMSAQSAVLVKNDVHNLSRAERAEIARRVQRGEKIWF